MLKHFLNLFRRKPRPIFLESPVVQVFKLGDEVEIIGNEGTPDGWRGFVTACKRHNGEWHYLVEGADFGLSVPESQLRAVSRG